MASENLERLWKSIIPLSSLPKTRLDTVLNASRLPPMAPVDGPTTTRRMQHELTQNRIEKLTERVDKIIDAVNQAKSSLTQADGKINNLMDKMLESTTCLVNRTQARVLGAVGMPVQEKSIKDLLESQKDILGVVSLMFQHTTALQANQSNLQASLIALMSQVQHIPTQMTSMEERLTQKLGGLQQEASLGAEQGRKRTLDADAPDVDTDARPSKRRKIGGREWSDSTIHKTPARQRITETATSSDKMPNVMRNASPPPSDNTSAEESPGSPLTPIKTQIERQVQDFGERLRVGLERVQGLGTASTVRGIGARLTKAQKLASFLGDDCEEEGSMEDLFLGLG